MSRYPPLEVTVFGPLACFTRPEMKVERVSYRCMTPSAARGILESIFWRPQFEWRVREIHVLKPVAHISFTRNEVSKKISVSPRSGAVKWMRDNGGVKPLYADRTGSSEPRVQRHTLALREVAYRICADISLCDSVTDHVAKYRDQFRRRVSSGQCYRRPYLGCREFAAYFREPCDDDEPITHSEHLGRMLFDINYDESSARGEPVFFSADIDNGILHVPDELYQRRSSS